MLIDAVNSEVP